MNISNFFFKYISFLLFFTVAVSVKSQELNCLDCHENFTLNSAHDKVAKCGDCHKDVVKEDHSDKGAKKVNCGNCHEDFDKQTNNDIHHKNNIAADKIPNCKTCHGTHNIKKLSNVKNKSKEFCGKCHKTDMLTIPYHTLSSVNNSCIECHTKKNYKKELNNSIHSRLSCSNCHGNVVNNMAGHVKDSLKLATADCYLCHGAIAAEHKESIHGISLSEGINEAAQCWNCHGSHNIKAVSSDSSMVYRTNLVKTCGACHDDPSFTKKHSFAIKDPGKMFSKSVHGKLTATGSKDSPTCVTCHGSHDIKNRIQQGSKISGVNLPNTCEKCHKSVVDDYKQSIHWIAVKKGVREAPSCNDCHSEHDIHAINTADKRGEIKKLQDKTCLECHQNLTLSERYGVSGVNASNYEDSYHGLAVKGGDKKAAMCVDCHNVHKILPKENPESPTNSNHLLNTCKKCHANATKVFSNSYAHVSKNEGSAKFIEDIVRTIYLWLIIIVIGGMLIHNLIIFVYDLREKHKRNKNEIRIPRLTINELIQHTLLLSSFTVLAFSGFLLKFQDNWWARELHDFGITEGVRQVVHRISAAVMIVLSVYHLIYLLSTSRGRFVLKSILPAVGDIRLAVQNMMFYLKLKKKHPEFENYNYIEKAEYWALIWGTIMMSITGLVLWFPTVVGNWAPVWFIKVSEIVHFYEAILATLAIIVWHYFFIIFRAKEYPLSLTVLDGKMTVTHYKEEHKASFNKLLAEWAELKAGKRKENELSHLTELFISALKKNDVDVDEFMKTEIEKDN